MMPAVPPLGAPGDLPVSPARAPILASPDTYRKLAAVWVSSFLVLFCLCLSVLGPIVCLNSGRDLLFH